MVRAPLCRGKRAHDDVCARDKSPNDRRQTAGTTPADDAVFDPIEVIVARFEQVQRANLREMIHDLREQLARRPSRRRAVLAEAPEDIETARDVDEVTRQKVRRLLDRAKRGKTAR